MEKASDLGRIPSRPGSAGIARRRFAARCSRSLPTISSWISRFSSTAYSIGSSFVTGSMKPLTIIAAASSSERPRDCR